MEVYQRLSEFAHTQMEKVWSRIILVHNSFFFKLFNVCLCNVLVPCYHFFFSTSAPLFWSTESVDSVGTTIFTLPKVISSFIFYWYQFNVCLFSNECQQYVFLVFSFFFFFQLSYGFFFSPQTCVDSLGATIFTFPVVIQLNVFIAVPNHFVFWKSKIFFLQVSTWRRQCGYLPRTSWKWPENKTNRVRRHLGDKMFSTVAKSVSGSQCLCSTKFVFLSQEHTDIQNTHKHDFLNKKIISEEKIIISTLGKYSAFIL